MSRVTLVVELEDADRDKLNKIAADQNVSINKLMEQLVATYLDPPVESTSVRPPGTSGDLYKWDEQKGALLFTPTNKRSFVINARGWGLVEQDLLGHFLRGAPPLLSEMGSAYGVAVAQDYRSLTNDPENVTSYFEQLGLVAGWGKFSVSGDVAKGSKIVVKVSNCVFCGSRNPSAERRDQCSFLIGVCKGIADTVFCFPHSVRETKCYAKGNDFCEFVVERATNSEQAGWPPGPDPMTGASRR